MAAFDPNSGHVSTESGSAPASTGSCLDDFSFTDVTKSVNYLYEDISTTHDFKLRGANYLADKVKVPVGSPLCKLILLELYEVNSEIDGDR